MPPSGPPAIESTALRLTLPFVLIVPLTTISSELIVRLAAPRLTTPVTVIRSRPPPPLIVRDPVGAAPAPGVAAAGDGDRGAPPPAVDRQRSGRRGEAHRLERRAGELKVAGVRSQRRVEVGRAAKVEHDVRGRAGVGDRLEPRIG